MFYLKEMAKQGQQSKIVILSERLPDFFRSPCELKVNYEVEAQGNFYLMHLHVSGELHLQCQRCLDEFNYTYDNKTILAVCRDDASAEKLLERYECVVSPSLQVSLDDVIIDELYLYAPQFHPEITDCSTEINQFLAEKNESY